MSQIDWSAEFSEPGAFTACPAGALEPQVTPVLIGRLEGKKLIEGGDPRDRGPGRAVGLEDAEMQEPSIRYSAMRPGLNPLIVVVGVGWHANDHV